jgi:hypothetical protein
VVLDEQFLGKWMLIRNVIFAVFQATFKNSFGVIELNIRKNMLKVRF